MYCIFESGGKQYKVSPGQRIRVEKLPVEVGKELSFDKLVMRAEDDRVEFGSPYLKGEALRARVIQHGRGDKITVIKFKRRKHYMRRLNHRQQYTEVEILSLTTGVQVKGAGGAKTKTAASPAAKAAPKTEKPAEKRPSDDKKAAAKRTTAKATVKAAKPAKKKEADGKKTAAKKSKKSATASKEVKKD